MKFFKAFSIKRFYLGFIAATVASSMLVSPALASEIQVLNTPNDFIESAFVFEERWYCRGNLTYLSPGWTYAGDSAPRSEIRYSRGLYDGVHPLDAWISYRSVGRINGRTVDGRVHLTNIGTWPSSYASYSNTTVNVKAFWDGFTMYCTSSLDVEYSLYWADSGEQIDMTNSWMTLGSLNSGEGVRHNTSRNVTAVVLRNNNLAEVATGQWVGINNDFTDYIGGPTFARNAVSFQAKEPTMNITMLSNYGAMWMCPYLTPLQNVKPDEPTKTCTVLN